VDGQIAEERPLSELLSDVTSQLQQLVRKEMELARVETKAQVSEAARAGSALGAAGAVGYVALILLASAGAYGLVRDDLGETLEAIGDRVAPQKVMARAKADLADKVDGVKERVSPLRLAGRGAGALRRGVRTAVGSGGGGTVPRCGGRLGNRAGRRPPPRASRAAPWRPRLAPRDAA
jgi:hypothetical protein